ncbi:MAG: hypothetical protein K2X44_12255, partial [Magnetospirillum sp.]|nr:hypothetical protein [Magnetospirillum sp.]
LRGRLPFPCWDYKPPFLPEGMSMPVALASDDPRQPFLFRSPGDARPDAWPEGMAGNRQQAAGLAEITGIDLDLPVGSSPAVRALVDSGFLTLKPAVRPRMVLTITKVGGGQRKLSLPDFVWLD